ncbi:MAG: hypothetical protein JWN76_1449 [Chitinophagaceae bacterium]|nr:hypothetical protein [Chitinophagaceae bacterium]
MHSPFTIDNSRKINKEQKLKGVTQGTMKRDTSAGNKN